MSKRSQRRNKAKNKQKTVEVPLTGGVEIIKKNFLERNYKKFLIIPIIILILAIIQIGVQTALTGDFIHKGISLAGGTSFFIEKEWDAEEIQSLLAINFPEQDSSVRELTNLGTQAGVIIETTAKSEADRDAIITFLNINVESITEEDYTVEFIDSTLGNQFFFQTFIALIIAFILMGLVVFIYFRTLIPSLAVILSAFSDIVITVAIVNLFGIKLSTAGIAAFLMLIGYSVDTDILLSTKMLKGKTSIWKRFMEAFTTGGTMIMTTILAVGVAMFFTQSDVVKQIMMIVLIGLIVDIMNTWILNAGLLRWYIERKNNEKGGIHA